MYTQRHVLTYLCWLKQWFGLIPISWLYSVCDSFYHQGISVELCMSVCVCVCVWVCECVCVCVCVLRIRTNKSPVLFVFQYGRSRQWHCCTLYPAVFRHSHSSVGVVVFYTVVVAIRFLSFLKVRKERCDIAALFACVCVPYLMFSYKFVDFQKNWREHNSKKGNIV
jgi:hypothetical protein